MKNSNWICAATVVLAGLSVAFAAGVAAAQTATQPSEKPAAVVAPDPVDAFIEKTKNPFPGFNWGMDLRTRWEYLNNTSSLNKDAPNHETSYMRYRGRWWATAQPLLPLDIKDLEFHIKLTWEGRSWCENEQITGWEQDRDQLLFDQLYVKYRKAFGLPLTITAGRQDLQMGDGWLTGDGTPLDGSRTFFVDGVRFDYDIEAIKTSLSVMWFEVDAQWDHWFPRIANKQVPGLASEQDEEGVMVYASNKSLKNTQIDGYFFYKHNEAEWLHVKNSGAERRSGTDAEIYTFGTRIAGDITSHWRYRADIAGQFGHRDGRNICALGTNNRITYDFGDKAKNQIYWDFEYTSGDDPDTAGTDEHFDILWGRWPRWTEGYGFTYGLEDRIWDLGNTYRVGPGWTCKPSDRIDLGLFYNFLFADQNTFRDRAGFSDSGCYRGQMFVPYFKYTFNKHLFARVMPEFFWPGDYYTDLRNDGLIFLRLEVVTTW